MPVLTSQQRKLLDDACVKGRRASEQAVRAALGSLAVTAERPPAHLSDEDRQLRRGLRAKSRQLGDQGDKLDLLIAECAYEQWHRLLFARFLAENNLLIHPEYRAPVTLEDCEDLAESLGEPDGWSVAGRFAAEILPGIFRLDDPCVQLRLAPEGRLALEEIVAGLPTEVFGGSDALGWAYQYWQREQKDLVNDSGRKIGGADLGPVTQLFTDDYMVRFLLQNSLGAWWAFRHPDSPLLKEWEHLGVGAWSPSTDCFGDWPASAAEVTVMDPCCGSGHFLVEAFEMLWRARAEEEGLGVAEAQDAVLRENLFGLELDPRCVQIASFALAIAAWRSGSGWRELPVPHVACSGIPVKAGVDEWSELARGDHVLEGALVRLHVLFREADTLGSLIDPRRAVEVVDRAGAQRSFEDAAWDDIAPLIAKASMQEDLDPASAVLGANAVGMARAADLLSRRYTLVATNVPYLGRTGQDRVLREHLTTHWPDGAEDLASAFAMRSLELVADGGTLAEVLPEPLLFLTSLANFRRFLLGRQLLNVAMLGPRAFAGIGGEVVRASLVILANVSPTAESNAYVCETPGGTPATKARELAEQSLWTRQSLSAMRESPGSRILAGAGGATELLSRYAVSVEGMSTGDGARYQRQFWELGFLGEEWALFQGAPERTALTGGLDSVVLWESGRGALSRDPGARVQGQPAWGRPGVLIERMSSLRATVYAGGAFQKKTVAVIPHDQALTAAIWAFCSSGEHKEEVSRIDRRIGLATSAIVDVPFDVDRWRAVAQATFPEGVTDPHTQDPTQCIFGGDPATATAPLQVGVSRLVGYEWPEQADSGELDALADQDGVVCLPSVRGERTAADRLQELLSRAFGVTWTAARTRELLSASGSTKPDLETWLRDDFFKGHCQVFLNRPFIWQVWDGRKDGFSALVNYHRLNRSTLEKLTYSYLGDWIERQAAGVRDDVAGAEERLAAARVLQQKLELILDGEPPYDIYVRWKTLAEQPIGWEPDLNDGVRLNVRPFVEAGVLRAKFNVKWDKDRGKNPDGSDRLNNLHYTNAQKRAALGASA